MKPPNLYEFVFTLVFAVCIGLLLAYICHVAAKEWGLRSCADPNAWAQKSYGRAVAECEAKGGFISENWRSKELSCVIRREVKP